VLFTHSGFDVFSRNIVGVNLVKLTLVHFQRVHRNSIKDVLLPANLMRLFGKLTSQQLVVRYPFPFALKVNSFNKSLVAGTLVKCFKRPTRCVVNSFESVTVLRVAALLISATWF